MTPIVEKLIEKYPAKQFVIPTTKQDVFAEIDRIRRTIDGMDDFDRFPEGATGTILYAMLKNASEICPDAGDFNYFHQGCEMALNTAFKVIVDEVEWFPGSKHL